VPKIEIISYISGYTSKNRALDTLLNMYLLQNNYETNSSGLII